MLNTSMRYFIEVARCRTISSAAAALHVASSAISRQIQKLEHAHRVELFERSASGMKLTAAGQLLYEHGLDIEAKSRKFRMDLSSMKRAKRRPTRIACVEAFARDYLPGAIGRYRALDTLCTFDLQVLSPSEVEHLVRSEEADIGMTRCLGSIEGVLTEASFAVTLCAIMSPSHPLATNSTLSLREIAPYDVVLSAENTTTRQTIDRLCADEDIELNSIFTSNYTSGIFKFVQDSQTIAFAAPPSISRLLRDASLVAVPLGNMGSPRHSKIITPSSPTKRPEVSAFLTFLVRDLSANFLSEDSAHQ